MRLTAAYSTLAFILLLLPQAWAEDQAPVKSAPVESAATTPVAAAVSSAELLKQGNTWYDQREIPGSVDKAIESYRKILAAEPSNFDVLWRLARCYWWQGDHAAKDKKIDLYDAGKTFGQQAQKAAPDKVDGYYWYGVCEGRASETRGVLNSLFAIDPIRQAMEKALSINSKYGPAHHVLGVLYRKAPGWPLSCGDINKSLEHARLAIEYSPDEVLFRVDLARTLLAKDQKEDAKKVLQEALELPGLPDKQPETKSDKETAQAVLNSLK